MDYVNYFPREILEEIFVFLDFSSLTMCKEINSKFYQLLKKSYPNCNLIFKSDMIISLSRLEYYNEYFDNRIYYPDVEKFLLEDFKNINLIPKYNIFLYNDDYKNLLMIHGEKFIDFMSIHYESYDNDSLIYYNFVNKDYLVKKFKKNINSVLTVLTKFSSEENYDGIEFLLENFSNIINVEMAKNLFSSPDITFKTLDIFKKYKFEPSPKFYKIFLKNDKIREVDWLVENKIIKPNKKLKSKVLEYFYHTNQNFYSRYCQNRYFDYFKNICSEFSDCDNYLDNTHLTTFTLELIIENLKDNKHILYKIIHDAAYKNNLKLLIFIFNNFNISETGLINIFEGLSKYYVNLRFCDTHYREKISHDVLNWLKDTKRFNSMISEEKFFGINLIDGNIFIINWIIENWNLFPNLSSILNFSFEYPPSLNSFILDGLRIMEYEIINDENFILGCFLHNLDIDSIEIIISNNSLEYDKYSLGESCISNNKIEYLKWIFKHDREINISLFITAIKYDFRDIIDWFKMKRLVWDMLVFSHDIYYHAILKNNINLLQWCLDKGFPYDHTILNNSEMNHETKQFLLTNFNF